MPQIALSEHPRTNPLDVVERIAAINDWSFERAGDDEITMLVGGKWSDYQVSFTWMYDIEALHLACAFDLKVPERRRDEVQKLIALVNEQLWIGHFDLWTQDGMVMFRHALVLAGGVEATEPAMPGAAVAARSKPARAISRPSSSWSGPASPRARRSTPPCSRPRARRRAARQSGCPAPRHGRASVPAIDVLHCARRRQSWMAGTSPAMTDDEAVAMAKSTKQQTPSPPFPARWCWSAPARWAAPCSTAGSPASCRRRRSSCWSRSRRRRSRRWRKRGVRINPKGDVGPVAALVIAVKPQTAPDALPPLAALIDAKTVVVSIMAGRDARLSRTGICRTPRSCAPCRTRRPRSAAASPSRSATAASRPAASSRMACSPRPARSNGWTTRR